MAFERIKKVGKYEYRYKVENVRENGKVKQKIVEYLGRADKQHSKKIPSALLTIPAGCQTDKEKEEYLKEMIDIGDKKFIIVSEVTLERLFRRALTPEETMDDVLARLLDATMPF